MLGTCLNLQFNRIQLLLFIQLDIGSQITRTMTIEIIIFYNNSITLYE